MASFYSKVRLYRTYPAHSEKRVKAISEWRPFFQEVRLLFSGLILKRMCCASVALLMAPHWGVGASAAFVLFCARESLSSIARARVWRVA